MNLNIRRVCAAHKRKVLLKAVILWTGTNFWNLRVWEARKKKESNKSSECTKTKMRVKEQNNHKLLESIEQWNEIPFFGQTVHQCGHMDRILSGSKLYKCLVFCGYLLLWIICVLSVNVNTCAPSIICGDTHMSAHLPLFSSLAQSISLSLRYSLGPFEGPN